ncbi:MAG: hypothetical protein KBT11_10080, partial [Treponema sp.]|nr:hypothetical protein [Candidatus Treponema equifaecale]
KFMWLPVKIGEDRLGFEAGAKLYDASDKNEFYDLEFDITEVKFNLVYRKNLAGNWLHGCMKFGAAFMALEKTNRHNDMADTESFGYVSAQAGASLMITPFKNVAAELGCEFSYYPIPDMPTLIACPYVCLGFRL